MVPSEPDESEVLRIDPSVPFAGAVGVVAQSGPVAEHPSEQSIAERSRLP